MLANDDVAELVASIDGKPPQKFVGRFAWCLYSLIQAGERGCTAFDRPAPRWSHDVHRDRKAGVSIETVHEGHKGTFSGRHARYVLRSEVEVLKVVRASETNGKRRTRGGKNGEAHNVGAS